MGVSIEKTRRQYTKREEGGTAWGEPKRAEKRRPKSGEKQAAVERKKMYLAKRP